MNKNSALVKRHAVRAFEDKAVDLDVLKDIVKEAGLAPSWGNSQPWKAYLAIGQTVKNIRATHFNSATNHVKGSPEVVSPKGWSDYAKNNMKQTTAKNDQFLGDDGNQDYSDFNAKLFNAPAIIYITIPKISSAYSTYDAGAFGYGLALSAYEHGLAAMTAYELIRYPKEIRDAFTIPEDEVLVMGVAIGYPQDKKLNQLHTDRNDLEKFLSIED